MEKSLNASSFYLSHEYQNLLSQLSIEKEREFVCKRERERDLTFHQVSERLDGTAVYRRFPWTNPQSNPKTSWKAKWEILFDRTGARERLIRTSYNASKVLRAYDSLSRSLAYALLPLVLCQPSSNHQTPQPPRAPSLEILADYYRASQRFSMNMTNRL